VAVDRGKNESLVRCARTIVPLVYPSAEFPDLRSKVPYFLGLADGAGLFFGHILIYAFRWIPMSTTGMAGFDSVTLDETRKNEG
jgi:hypothetical protein